MWIYVFFFFLLTIPSESTSEITSKIQTTPELTKTTENVSQTTTTELVTTSTTQDVTYKPIEPVPSSNSSSSPSRHFWTLIIILATFVFLLLLYYLYRNYYNLDNESYEGFQMDTFNKNIINDPIHSEYSPPQPNFASVSIGDEL